MTNKELEEELQKMKEEIRLLTEVVLQYVNEEKLITRR